MMGRTFTAIGNVPDTHLHGRVAVVPDSLGFAWGPLLSKIGTGVTQALNVYGGYRSLKDAKAAEKAARQSLKPTPIQTGYVDRTVVPGALPMNWKPIAAGLGVVALLLLLNRGK